ncbi:hypothetical protein AB7714_06010 [Tardiphaga sp. 1201_B9_N1_1]|uniref:hypothetical protein n=1 Tax=unclassified Tardiphaga TaxID=2631404 RepID=UPI003F27C9A8
MALARVQHVSVSLDGFATGEGQSLDAPFGHAGERLHQWMFATRWGRPLMKSTREESRSARPWTSPIA